MEQQIDPKTKIELGVGTDPAFIPGLTGPSPAVKDRKEEGSRAGTAEAVDAAPETAADDVTAGDAGVLADEAGGEPAGESAADTDDATPDGPAFQVGDRRGSITANRSGLRFTLDDQEAEFAWDEIGAVEVKPARFGRRFTVTVHVAANRWFNADVEAPARARLKEWAAELDAVLDAYFDED
ncbi:hypothetical protein [Streptomyces peucetius]|uniref:Uncharacterized protein n=1 Tax=Streptomyces peucetius TaxID=1950 RepID=A0ABY6IDD8_STRPE|nr:hypothetical protein [Streptomyces peucetius]UYQ65026.1 hypothetical protein OGH68_28585 [Streptomyces peucetius]